MGRIKSTIKSTFVIGGFLCCADNFVVKESSNLSINIYAKNLAHRKSANRYVQL